MSIGYVYYAITLLTFLGVNIIACWALDLQFGTTGILNFGFILFQAAGAYTAAVLTLGPPQFGALQTYIGGASLPWPLPWLAAMGVGGLLALAVGSFALRPERRDYQGVAMLLVAVVGTIVVSTKPALFNGTNGLAGVPKPFAGLNLGLVSYGWFYVALVACTVGVVYFALHQIKGSPWGRQLRAIRENPEAASTLGVNVRKDRLRVYVIGGAIGALSGAMLVQFTSAWAPDSWVYGESFVYLTAIIVGGAGNALGVALGTAVVQTGVTESVQFFPAFNAPGVVAALQWVTVGLLVIGFMWWRPHGLVPERRRTFRRPTSDDHAARSPAPPVSEPQVGAGP